MNLDLLKYVLFLGLAPFWVPFAKELWKEFLLAMRPEGGLFGPVPGPVERRQIEERIRREEPRVVHETLANAQRRRTRGPSPSGTGTRPTERRSAPNGGPQTGVHRRGFGGSTRGGGFR